MKKLLLFGSVFLVLLGLLALPRASREEKAEAQFWADREALEMLAREILERGSTEDVVLPDGWSDASLYRSGVHTVEFSLGSSGFASETAYWGVNYVPSDNSAFLGRFWGQTWEYWKPQGDGRLYYEPEGDNTCYVKKLDECWYYYELRF